MRPGEQATPRTSARLDEPATSKTSAVPNSRAELLEVLLRVDAEVKTMLPASLRRPPSRASARQSERHDGPPSNTAEHLHPANTSKRRICCSYHSCTHLRHLRARHRRRRSPQRRNLDGRRRFLHVKSDGRLFRLIRVCGRYASARVHCTKARNICATFAGTVADHVRVTTRGSSSSAPRPQTLTDG